MTSLQAFLEEELGRRSRDESGPLEVFDAVDFAPILLSAFAVSGAVIDSPAATMRTGSSSSAASVASADGLR